MAEILNVQDFLNAFDNGGALLLDVRSESEFRQGHIPRAVNLPLLNDEHRAIVGTIYKQKGREAAVLSGFDLVGNKFGDFIRSVLQLSKDKHVMLYCWRGGMRSNIMAWILNASGFKVTLLKGGYKFFRRWSLEQFTQQKKIIIIGGRTGSGKTELLKILKEKKETVIDLEGLAHHKGSAFGGLGEKPQPRTEYFENKLAMEWSRVGESEILWLENESVTIGSVKIPNLVFEMMRSAPVIELRVDMETRIKRILEDYGRFSVKDLSDCTVKLKKRLGDLRTKQAVAALSENNKRAWVEEILFYYDRTYDYGMSQRNASTVFPVDSAESKTLQDAADQAISISQSLKEKQRA